MNKLLILFNFMTWLVMASMAANAQPFPSKPIRILVGTPPGGGADFVARTLAPRMSESMGVTVVVDNRPGANGVVASEVLARAVPDGYTLKVNIIGDVINPSLMKLNFELKDFAFISQVAESQNMLVAHPSFPAKNARELLVQSKKNPGAISYGSQGIGSSGHLSGELFQYMTGVKWVHVPYKGGALALVDLMAGQISISFGNIPTVIQQVHAKKLRALAMTGAKRSAAAPEIPTVAESAVPGFAVSNWFGIAATAKTPLEVQQRLNSEVTRAMKLPEVRTAFLSSGADPVETTLEQYQTFVQAEFAKWAKVIKAAGIKGE